MSEPKIGYDGPVPIMIAGYRGAYVPRKPLLLSDTQALERRRLWEEVTYRKQHERMLGYEEA